MSRPWDGSCILEMMLLDKNLDLWYNVYVGGGGMWWKAAVVGFLVGVVVGSAVTLRLCSRLGSIEYAIYEVASKSVPW